MQMCISHFSFLNLPQVDFHFSRYEQLIDHTKALSGRTYKIVSQLLEQSQAQPAR